MMNDLSKIAIVRTETITKKGNKFKYFQLVEYMIIVKRK